jgi:multidrug efflux pump subunit AcrA (membrane-fusion protein)
LLLIFVGSTILVVALLAWWILRPADLPLSIVTGNGRIEATEIDIATKIPGRIVEIKPREGDFVKAGEVLARMDTIDTASRSMNLSGVNRSSLHGKRRREISNIGATA